MYIKKESVAAAALLDSAVMTCNESDMLTRPSILRIDVMGQFLPMHDVPGLASAGALVVAQVKCRPWGWMVTFRYRKLQGWHDRSQMEQLAVPMRVS